MVRRDLTGQTMHRYRTHSCGELRPSHIGESVRLSGWCHRIRDHGGVLFIDLRDHYGLTQVVADPDSPAFAAAEAVRSEFVVRVDGLVRQRPPGTENPDRSTGSIEVFVTDLEVLGPAAELPVPVFGDLDYPEETRLTYRFLDLRREKLHKNIMTRIAAIDSIRRRMKDAGFFEFQTPILTASSPEGARDFLVPSRLHAGRFYALPQAPQQYKQLIMISGFDRYFQIAPCFRDEDPRADRLPGEFYQLDVEMSFVTQEDVWAAMEPVIRGVFYEFAEGRAVTPTFPRIKYAEAMLKYGTDKPDLRNPLEMQDVSEHFRGSAFKIFSRILEDSKNRIWAIPAPRGGNRAFCDRMNAWAQGEGQPGLGYIIFGHSADVTEGEANSPNFDPGQLGPERWTVSARGPIANAIGQETALSIGKQLGLNRKLGGDAYPDAVFFVAGDPARFVKFAGMARDRIGKELELVDEDKFAFCWITDFPMYEWSEEEKKIDFSHNPFSMPNIEPREFLALDQADKDRLLALTAFQYDLVCNGYEIASGAIRNHRPDVMRQAFGIAGYEESVLEERFGGMYRAFQYGAPPHGGMAAGIDRIVMLLCGAQNLREVTMFPMNQRAEDLLLGAPSEVAPKQLRELHIRLNLPEK
jgi:aspartyl-tRNA synthetase